MIFGKGRNHGTELEARARGRESEDCFIRALDHDMEALHQNAKTNRKQKCPAYEPGLLMKVTSEPCKVSVQPVSRLLVDDAPVISHTSYLQDNDAVIIVKDVG